MAAQEAGQGRHYQRSPPPRMQQQAQAPPGQIAATHHLGLRLRQLIEDCAALQVEVASILGQRDATRAAVEQRHAQRNLQRGDGLADRRAGQPQRHTGRCEAGVLRHAREHSDAAGCPRACSSAMRTPTLAQQRCTSDVSATYRVT